MELLYSNTLKGNKGIVGLQIYYSKEKNVIKANNHKGESIVISCEVNPYDLRDGLIEITREALIDSDELLSIAVEVIKKVQDFN